VAVSRRNVIFALFALIGLLLDQITKWWVVAHIELNVGEIQVIPGLFSIVHAQNPGAAFGLFGNFAYRHYLFGLFTLIAGAVILDLFRKLPREEWFMSAALGLIMSGAVGNAIDRVRQAYVTDFLRVYTEVAGPKQWLFDTFGTSEWPTFNVADAALVVGVLMFIVHQLFLEDADEEEETAAA